MEVDTKVETVSVTTLRPAITVKIVRLMDQKTLKAKHVQKSLGHVKVSQSQVELYQITFYSFEP